MIFKSYMMVKTVVFTIIISATFSINAFGQYYKDSSELNSNYLNIQLGLSRGVFKDLNYSPLNYTSKGMTGILSYERGLRNRDVMLFSLSFETGELTAENLEFTLSENYKVNVSLGYLKKISNTSSRLDFYVGSRFNTYQDLTFYDDSESITFFGLTSIDFGVRTRYPVTGRSSLSVQFFLPVYGFLVRPPYAGWDKFIFDNEDRPIAVLTRGNWTSMNDFFGLDLQLTYEHKLSQRFVLIVQYDFKYYHTDLIKTAKIASSQTTIGSAFKF